MHARVFIAATVAVVALSFQVAALQSTLTEKEYQASMKEISLTVGDAEGHLQARYWGEIEADAGRLISEFEKVEAFWKARNTEKAAAIAKKAKTAAVALDNAAVKDDHIAAGAAISRLKETCESCHPQYREKTDDGYRIKANR